MEDRRAHLWSLDTRRPRTVQNPLRTGLVILMGLTPHAAFAVCGDGMLDGGEECDDGNLSGTDGCDASCLYEPGYDCVNTQFSTGVDEFGVKRAQGQDDLFWTVSNTLGGAPDPTIISGTTDPDCPNTWTVLPDAEWISADSFCGAISFIGPRYFQRTFNVDANAAPQLSLDFNIGVTWNITEVYLNGSPLGYTLDPTSNGTYQTMTDPFSIPAGSFVAGTNTLEFHTTSRGGDSGLLVQQIGETLTVCTEVDTDGDGLSDATEAGVGTDPLDPDTDGDTLIDGDEVAASTSPLDADTDDDGLSDGEEFYGTGALIAFGPTDPLLAVFYVRVD